MVNLIGFDSAVSAEAGADPDGDVLAEPAFEASGSFTFPLQADSREVKTTAAPKALPHLRKLDTGLSGLFIVYPLNGFGIRLAPQAYDQADVT